MKIKVGDEIICHGTNVKAIVTKVISGLEGDLYRCVHSDGDLSTETSESKPTGRFFPEITELFVKVDESVDESKGVVDERVDDCISRQAVLKAIDVKAWEFCDYLIHNDRNDEQKPVLHFADNLRECISEDLSSVTPVEKVGRWIEKDGYDGDTYYDCSECGESWTTIDGTPWNNGMKYCPNCGAKMEVKE